MAYPVFCLKRGSSLYQAMESLLLLLKPTGLCDCLCQGRNDAVWLTGLGQSRATHCSLERSSGNLATVLRGSPRRRHWRRPRLCAGWEGKDTWRSTTTPSPQLPLLRQPWLELGSRTGLRQRRHSGRSQRPGRTQRGPFLGGPC